MDIWDELLTNRRDEFEEEPKDGHFDRFREKLSTRNSRKKRWHFSPFLKVAAVLLIILISADLLIRLTETKPHFNEMSTVKNDLNEASYYYTTKINRGIQDLEKMAGEGIGSKKEIVQIKRELSEMDSLFVNLKQEYKANPNDERIINAMIEYYQTKLDIVNTIKTDLENVKQLKSKNHESPKI